MILPLVRNTLNTDRRLQFSVCRSDDFRESVHNPVGMYVSRKVNGIRLVVHLRHGHAPAYYTRKGHRIMGLDRLDPAMIRVSSSLGKTEVVLDGELTLARPGEVDALDELLSEVQKKDHIIEDARFYAFDIMPAEKFIEGRYQNSYGDRRLILDIMASMEDDHFRVLPQHRIASLDDWYGWIARATAQGWEGLVLRANAVYSGQLTEDVLRVKQWKDCELPIVGFSMRDASLHSLQATFHGRSIDLPTHQVSATQLEPFQINPQLLLGSEVTVAWPHNTLANPRIIAIHQGGRKV